jgi:hypothetical protein
MQVHYVRITILFCIVIAVILSCNHQDKEPLIAPRGSILLFDTLSGTYKISSEDKKLVDNWEAFAKAALNADFVLLKSMSANCISCMNCMQLNEEFSDISVDTFYSHHANFIFDSFFVSLMNNNEHVRASYKLDDWYPDTTCITSETGMVNPKGVNVFVNFPLRKGQGEGSTAVLDFIETTSGYKFYGYWTIP